MATRRQPPQPARMRSEAQWSLSPKRDATKADFSAALDMELTEGWALTKNGGNLDPRHTRGAHTHHITLVDADDASAWR